MKWYYTVLFLLISVLAGTTARAQSAYHGGKGDGYSSAGVSNVILSIEEKAGNGSVLSVYPNPVMQGQELRITYKGLPGAHITLCDAAGRQVIPLVRLSSAEGYKGVPLNGLAPGIYFLRCNGSEGMSEQKIVVY